MRLRISGTGEARSIPFFGNDEVDRRPNGTQCRSFSGENPQISHPEGRAGNNLGWQRAGRHVSLEDVRESMPWYLYLALKQLFPSGRRVAFFTLASVAGVMLGVAVLIIVLSVMNGFGDEIRTKIIETNGHVRIENGGIMYDQDSVMAKVRGLPEVAAVTPYARGMVMLQLSNRPNTGRTSCRWRDSCSWGGWRISMTTRSSSVRNSRLRSAPMWGRRWTFTRP
jgi:hypothetical protein